jgi:hypothetical protein
MTAIGHFNSARFYPMQPSTGVRRYGIEGGGCHVLVCSDDIISPLRSFNPGLLCRGRLDFSCSESWMRPCNKGDEEGFLDGEE